MAAISTLERKLERHMKESADQIRSFKSELKSLRTMPKLKASKFTAESKDKKTESHLKTSSKSHKPKNNEQKSFSSMASIPKKLTKSLNLLHHPNDNEMKNERKACSVISSSSSMSRISEANSVMTKINYEGNSMKINCNPLKLIQFLVSELKMKLRIAVLDDGKGEISKVLKEINYAIKQAFIEHGLCGSSDVKKLPENQTDKQGIDSRKAENDKQLTSKDTQTDLYGDEVDKLREFHDKYLEKQLKLNDELRHVEGSLAEEMEQSKKQILVLREDMIVMQTKLNDEIINIEGAIAHRVEVRIEEIKSEMNLFKEMIEETRNHNLIDNMHKKLAQTNKKLNDVKRKCTEATRHCLKVQFENLLMNSIAAPRTDEIGHELGIIKSNFGREIAALKNAIASDFSQLHPCRMNPSASLTSASSAPIRKAFDESIKSATKWNEKSPEISFDDKFSSIIDDERKPSSEQQQQHRAEINNNASRRNYNDVMLMPHDHLIKSDGINDLREELLLLNQLRSTSCGL